MEIVDLLNLSVAGKKYEISLTKALNTLLGDNLKIVSLSKQGRREARRLKINEVFQNKCYIQTNTVYCPIVSDLVRDTHFFFILLKWSLVNIRNKRVVVILNSPFGVCFSALIFKYLTGVKPVSLTIDTPFTQENFFVGILGWYNKIIFAWGHYLLRLFSGIIVLNKCAVEALKLRIPFLVSTIGYEERNNYYLFEQRVDSVLTEKVKKIVYTGTLTLSKGIITLINAFRDLDQDVYQLNIYGYGPLEADIREIAASHKNIIFHGRIEYKSLLERISEADLLVNATDTNNLADQFSFPSKLIDYMLSGRPVLTTRSRSIPKGYFEFLFFIDEQTPEGFKHAIRNFFLNDPLLVKHKTLAGINYIRKKQNWTIISKKIVNFVTKL